MFAYCKKCGSDQAYKQRDEEGISWVYCPVCGFKESLKNYFRN